MIANPFNHAAFQMTELTKALNLMPFSYGRLEELNVFPLKPVRFRQVMVEEKEGVLSLIPTQKVGMEGAYLKRVKRRMRSLLIPHIPYEDVILASEVEGVRSFGSDNALEGVAHVITEHLEMMKTRHAITLEHLRMGALKGVVLDAHGEELIDLYKTFEIKPKTLSFELENPETSVQKKCLDLKRHMEDHLKGDVMMEIRVLVGEGFFDALTTHPSVKEAYQRYQDGAILRGDLRKGFPLAGVTFEEYRARVTGEDGKLKPFIKENEGHAFPLGTKDTFCTYVAPADFNETVNTLGQLLYAKQEPRRFERGTDVHTQSNPLPVCHRPGVLVKVTI